MKRLFLYGASFLALGLIGALYWRSPTRSASVGAVTILFSGFETNDNTNVTGRFVISNAGPYVLKFGVRTEIKRDQAWDDPPEGRALVYEPEPLLLPGCARSFRVMALTRSNSWRVAALCEKFYDLESRYGRARLDFDWYVRKRAFIETFHSSEVSP